jgi:hypothetical protein
VGRVVVRKAQASAAGAKKVKRKALMGEDPFLR